MRTGRDDVAPVRVAASRFDRIPCDLPQGATAQGLHPVRFPLGEMEMTVFETPCAAERYHEKK